LTKFNKRAVLLLFALPVAAGVASEVYGIVDRRAITREVEQARAAALASTSPTTVPADARRWLESNGFHVVVWNPHEPHGYVGMQESTSDGRHLIVEGQRQIRQASWLGEPTWLNLTFRFTLDGDFHDVVARESRLDVAACRVAPSSGLPPTAAANAIGVEQI